MRYVDNNDQLLEVYASADRDAEVIGFFPHGSQIVILGEENDYFIVRYGEQVGFIGGFFTSDTPPLTPQANEPVCECSRDSYYNCGNFSTHQEVQACYSYCISVEAGDVHRLNGDGDGEACESLP